MIRQFKEEIQLLKKLLSDQGIHITAGMLQLPSSLDENPPIQDHQQPVRSPRIEKGSPQEEQAKVSKRAVEKQHEDVDTPHSAPVVLPPSTPEPDAHLDAENEYMSSEPVREIPAPPTHSGVVEEHVVVPALVHNVSERPQGTLSPVVPPCMTPHLRCPLESDECSVY